MRMPLMRLLVVTPLTIVVDEAIASLRAEDVSGQFGILPGHAPFLTALEISVVRWKTPEGRERYCAVRGGALTVADGRTISISTREAVTGESFATLDQTVLAGFRAEQELERTEHTEATMLELNVVRQLVARLRPHQSVGPQ